MGYGLGVDLGTTFTAAAVVRDGRAEMVSLGDRSASVPSVVLLRADGVALTGDAAHRRAASEPDRVAREVKRRLGDPTPVLLGGAPQPVQELMAMQLRDVVRAVSEREGGAPDSVTLTHPANWGPYKKELFEQIPPRAGLDTVGYLTEPEGAAAHYASTERVPDGSIVAVYDLGGGTFDATVVRKTGDGFEILGTPEGIEGLGGIDFDEAVYAHVDRALDGALSELDPSDAKATAAAVRLRHECVLAKEGLSADTEATIPVMLPGLQTEVRLTRGEFEAMVVPSVTATVESMRRALRSAGVTPEDLHTVLLVGGSSRIPAVARMVSAELGRPTSVDAHPKHSIALGAAALAGRSAARGTAAPTVAVGPAAAAAVAGAGAVPSSTGPVDDTPTPPNGMRAVPGRAAPTGAHPPAGHTADHPTAAHPTVAFPTDPRQTAVYPASAHPAARYGDADGRPRSAAGAPPPSLAATPTTKKSRRKAARAGGGTAGASGSAPRGRRKAGVWIGGGVLVAAAAIGAALFFGGATPTPAEPVPAAATSAPPTPAPTTEAAEQAVEADPVDEGSSAPTARKRVPTSEAAVAPAAPSVASAPAPAAPAPAAGGGSTGSGSGGGSTGSGSGSGSGTGSGGGTGSGSGSSGTGSGGGTGSSGGGTGGGSGTGTGGGTGSSSTGGTGGGGTGGSTTP